MLSPSHYVPDQHANSLYFHDQELINVVPTVQAQARQPSSPTPSTSSLTSAQLAEMMFVPKPSGDSGKHAANPSYLTQCKSRLRKYQSDSMRDFADLLIILYAFSQRNKFRQFRRRRDVLCFKEKSVWLYTQPQ